MNTRLKTYFSGSLILFFIVCLLLTCGYSLGLIPWALRIIPWAFGIMIGLMLLSCFCSVGFMDDKENFRQYLSNISMTQAFIFFLMTELIAILYFGFKDKIILFLEFFHSKVFFDFLSESFKTTEGITLILTALTSIFLYFYFFGYIARKGAVLFISTDGETRYIVAISQIINIFGFSTVILYAIYLNFISSIFEGCIVLLSFFGGFSLSILLVTSYKKISTSYLDLVILNDFILNKNTKWVTNDILMDALNRSFFLTFGPFLQIFCFLILIVIGLGILAEFNILSIIIIVISLLRVYFTCINVRNLPKNRLNIRLNTGESLERVYILTTPDDDSLNLLRENNGVTKIFKENIKYIEYPQENFSNISNANR